MRAWIARVGFALAAVGASASMPEQYALGGQIIPVPRIVIYAGDVISDSALDDRELVLGNEPERSWYISRTGLIGKVARRTLLPGQAIPLVAVKAPDLVQAGKPVTLAFAAGQLTIVGRGIAMQSGGLGATVSVQNHDSGTIVRGRVGQDGRVWVED